MQRQEFFFYYHYRGIPMLLGQSIWGLCGTWAPLHGEPSMSGSSFSWNGRGNTKEDDTWLQTPPGSKSGKQTKSGLTLLSCHFQILLFYWEFRLFPGSAPDSDGNDLNNLYLMYVQKVELSERKQGHAWWMFIWALLVTYVHIQWDFLTFLNKIWSLIKDKADVSMAN